MIIDTNENKFLELINSIPSVAVQGYDRERNVIFWNDASVKLYGYSKEEALGKKLEELIIPDEMTDDVIKSINSWYENDESIPSAELTLKHKDGSGVLVFSSHVMLAKDTDSPELFCIDINLTKHKKRNELLELAFIGSNDGIWDWNILDNSVYFSPRWKEILGFSDDELANEVSAWEERIHPDDLENTWLDVQNNVERKTEYYENTHRLKHRDGHWVWILDRGKAFYDGDGVAVRMIGTHTDITDEKDLQLKFALQSQILEQVSDSVISTDIEGNIVSWNMGSEKMLGYKADEIIGKNMSIIHREEDVQENLGYAKRLIDEGPFSVEAYLVKKSKELVHVSVSLSLLKDEDENIIGLIGVSQDISQRKKAEKELLEQKTILDHQAHHDALTDLPNRVLFNDRLSQAIEKAARNKKELALFFIDLDHFKEINDSLGHVIGDKVLVEISTRLKSAIRKEDSLARLGGDEFTVLIEDLNNGQDASLLAQKILHVLAEPIYVDEHVLYVSSSIGISLYPQDDIDMNKLLMYADTAMYKAKDEGRDNFQFYSAEMTELAFERIVIHSSLRKALENREFVLYYQPQFNAKTSEFLGMEALVRWEHPEKGLLLPAEFIHIAHETGLIVAIDRWVMKTAMKQMVQWYKDGFNPGVLALNLSMKQLRNKDFISVLKKMLIETGCKAEWLEFEVTEGQIMDNPKDAITILRSISEMGIELAIDDFGTGYSSLSYLKRLPIDKLKIDKSFIEGLPDDEEDSGISKAVIALSKSLKLSVIAEGVETEEQRDFLIKNGCENIQGYLYSRAVPAYKLEEKFLKNWTNT